MYCSTYIDAKVQDCRGTNYTTSLLIRVHRHRPRPKTILFLNPIILTLSLLYWFNFPFGAPLHSIHLWWWNKSITSWTYNTDNADPACQICKSSHWARQALAKSDLVNSNRINELKVQTFILLNQQSVSSFVRINHPHNSIFGIQDVVRFAT